MHELRKLLGLKSVSMSLLGSADYGGLDMLIKMIQIGSSDV